jgi:hypothetical protein
MADIVMRHALQECPSFLKEAPKPMAVTAGSTRPSRRF